MKFNRYYNAVIKDCKKHPVWVFLFFHKERERVLNQKLRRARKYQTSGVVQKHDSFTETEDKWCPTEEEIEEMKNGISIEELKQERRNKN